MDRRGCKASTRERKTYAVMSFFRFLHHHGVIGTNVAAKLIPPRPKRPESRFMSEEECQRLLRVCSHDPRDTAIVHVLHLSPSLRRHLPIVPHRLGVEARQHVRWCQQPDVVHTGPALDVIRKT